MTEYRLVAEPRADLDIAAAFHWYEGEEPGLGLEFLDQLSAAYDRIVADPLKYQNLESGIRRALLRRFPYAVYFALESDVVVILAVLPGDSTVLKRDHCLIVQENQSEGCRAPSP